VDGKLVGIYGTWYQNDANRLGAYVDTWLQYGWFDNKVEGDMLPKVSYKSRGWAVSGEAGYAIALRDNWVIEPQAQVIHVNLRGDDVSELNGTAVSQGSRNNLITRLGARFYRTYVSDDDRKIQPFVGLNWWHSSNSGGIGFNGTEMNAMYPLNRYELKVGVNADLGKRWTGWTNLSGSLGSQDYYQYALRVGVKYSW
ncbi:autotransporter outer membrane beta-barrel domain-containing protein, partial [Ralstonia pseudosolanacearum]|uniref:autotransporter outer membrane beta-barrel domain-containing protein n=1 Tax=Ralstonia pseudosolanacearum TaxID=1310165 RepID=UPI003D28EBC2